MQRVMKNDTVEIIGGNDRGKRGRVLQVLPREEKVLVEGVRYIWRHVRPSQQNPQGGRVQKEAPIEISKVLPVCPACERGVRVCFKGQGRGKVRVCARCGHEIAVST
ncbi:MAG: 50S ribosomal protein L24 [Planctomycetota bacterium]|jgi:large subunit ribosomal protein L24